MNNKSRGKVIGFMLALILLGSACGRVEDMIQPATETATEVPGAPATQAVETFIARKATEATLYTPTPRPPTATASPSSTPRGDAGGVPIETIRPSITPTSPPLSGGVLIAMERFEIFSGWYATEADNYEMGMDEGGYRMAADMVTLNTPVYSVRDFIYRDIQVEVDVMRFSGPDGSYFGVTCRFTDINNFYAFVMDADGYYEISKTVNGEYTVIDSGSKKGLFVVDAEKNHIRADCYSGTLTLTINSKQMLSVQDSALWEGKVGLLLGTNLESGAKILFDNFALYQP